MARSICASVLVLLAARTASADPIRLRGDAFATAESPAGLLTLQGSDQLEPWIDAEAVVWMGAGDQTAADTLIVDVDLRDPKHRGDLRVGRQIIIAGALRPLHLDGANGTAHVGPFDLELFGGLPVVPRLGPRADAWTLGARASRKLGKGDIGLEWLQERESGDLSIHELGADAGYPLGEHVDLAAASSLDLVSLGLAEARASASWSKGKWRVEAFGVDRSPAHLLPATSLFSVLGDNDAGRAGVSTRWRAAPRLDVDVTAAGRFAALETPHEDLTASCMLRLDERGDSMLGLELHRQGGADGWTGARGTARIAIAQAWTASSEVELVVPDTNTMTTGTVWPWALGAVSWKPDRVWEIAGAVEASASPQYRYRFDALLRASRSWGGP